MAYKGHRDMNSIPLLHASSIGTSPSCYEIARIQPEFSDSQKKFLIARWSSNSPESTNSGDKIANLAALSKMTVKSSICLHQNAAELDMDVFSYSQFYLLYQCMQFCIHHLCISHSDSPSRMRAIGLVLTDDRPHMFLHAILSRMV